MENFDYFKNFDASNTIQKRWDTVNSRLEKKYLWIISHLIRLIVYRSNIMIVYKNSIPNIPSLSGVRVG